MADHFTKADGRQLAVDMLRELGEEWKARDLEDVPDGEIAEAMLNAEPETLRRYLKVVRARRSPALERGFLCVLSDYLGGAVGDGCMPNLDCYEAHDGRGHTAGPSNNANA